MKSNKDEASARDLFVGAFGLCRNRSAHHEIKFDDWREVVDMICFTQRGSNNDDFNAIGGVLSTTWTRRDVRQLDHRVRRDADNLAKLSIASVALFPERTDHSFPNAPIIWSRCQG
jgi:hypothetical protein